MTHLFSWVWLLVVYLWALGGLGWIHAYEFSQQRKMKRPAKVIGCLLWPVLSAVSLVQDLFQHGE